MASTGALVLAGLLLARCCCAFEDAEALIQHRKAVDSMQVELAQPSPDQVLMTRVSVTGEPGSSILLNYSRFCSDEDAFGPQECSIYYGKILRQTFKLHLAGGIRSGEVFSQTHRLSLDHNSDSALSFLVPDDLYLKSDCGFCQDSCYYTSVKQGAYSLNITIPTTLDGVTCDGTEEDFVVGDKTILWFRPPPGLELSGNMTFSAAVYTQAGAPRVEASYRYRLTAPPKPATLVADASPAPAAGAEEAAPSPPLSSLSLLREVLLGTGAEAAQAVSDAAAGAGSRATLADVLKSGSNYTLVLNMTLKDLAPGNTISVSASQGCTATDGSGSLACEFSVDDNISFSSSVDVSFNAQEGSTLYTSSQATAGGNMNLFFPNAFKRKERTVPLCGSGEVEITGTDGKPTTYRPWKCGAYAVRFQSSAQEFTSLQGLTNFPLPKVPFMPFLPRNFDDVLPFNQESEFKLTSHDNVTIVHLSLVVGIKHT